MMQLPRTDKGGASDAPLPTLLAEYPRYEQAQEAVDRLSDEGFPVEHVSIVWSRLRQIEYVTGRRTTLTAAMQGAISGAWFGSFIGLLLAFFVDLDEGVSAVGLVVSYALVGAVVVAAFTAFQHWSRRGRRDFSTVGTLQAESYEVWVHPDHVHRAAAVLGITMTQRAIDPDPAAEPGPDIPPATAD